MFPAGFEPAVPESEQPQTHALDRVAAGISADSLIAGSFLASGTITPDAPKYTTKLDRVVIYQRLQMKWHRSHLDTDLFQDFFISDYSAPVTLKMFAGFHVCTVHQ